MQKHLYRCDENITIFNDSFISDHRPNLSYVLIIRNFTVIKFIDILVVIHMIGLFAFNWIAH